MIRESIVDSTLNRLAAHFGARLVIHPPIAAEGLAQLEKVAGPLPRELIIFLSTCNGLRVHADGRDLELSLWGSQEVLSSVGGPMGPGIPLDFLPIRGDPTGERDWLVLGHGLTGGMIVRRDPWVPGCEIMASTYGAYLCGWTDYLLQRFRPDGKDRFAGQPALTFDARFLESHDKALVALRRDPRIAEWLRSIGQAVACGDDYE
jgi:hypothetical protein